MNKKINKITLSSTFLSISGFLYIFQFPITSVLFIDFSYVSLLISRRYVGYISTIIICFIAPWFSLLSFGNIIGVLFLILQSIFLITLDFILNNDKTSYLNILIIIFFVTIWSIFINIFLIAPLYQGWNDYYSMFIQNSIPWIIVSLWFNIFKLSFIYIIFLFLYKVINFKN